MAVGSAVCNVSNGSPGWGVIDLFAWKLVPARWGGGRAYIQKFKDAWVRHNKQLIVNEAKKYQLPPELLAGVCWIEVGGDPSFIDRVAFEIRSFDCQEEARIIGARYNRGVGLTLEQIRKNTSYGNFIVKFWDRFSQLIQ